MTASPWRPWRCPPRDEVLSSLLALLPRGRAWQTHEAGPPPYHNAGFDGAAFDPAAFDTVSRAGSILYRFFASIADVLAFATQRLCDLRLEFWCATQRETTAEWMADYGLPDDCDPFPYLCDKVAARGGATCVYFNDRIARKGWRAECYERVLRCGSRYGKGRFGCRTGTFGNNQQSGLVIRVHVGDGIASPSPAESYHSPRFGCGRFGHKPSCAPPGQPSIAAVRCLIERIVPAHVAVEYVI